MIRTLIDFIAATVCTFVLASLFHTQFVLYELTKLGVLIDTSTRLKTSVEDFFGLLPAYGSAILVALLLGFLVVKAIAKLTKVNLNYLYPIAGATALLVALMAMQPILNITLIAGAREPLGLTMQCLAGLFGGWVFMYQRNKAQHPSNRT